MQQPFQNLLDDIGLSGGGAAPDVQLQWEKDLQEVINYGEDIADQITRVPETYRDLADDYNDDVIEAAERLKGRAADTARQNVIENKVGGTISGAVNGAVRWLMRRPVAALGIVAAIIILIRR